MLKKMTDISPEPLRRFPSGRRVGFHCPPDSVLAKAQALTGRPLASVIWIDSDCIFEAEQILSELKSGKITASDAESKLYALEYGKQAEGVLRLPSAPEAGEGNNHFAAPAIEGEHFGSRGPRRSVQSQTY